MGKFIFHSFQNVAQQMDIQMETALFEGVWDLHVVNVDKPPIIMGQLLWEWYPFIVVVFPNLAENPETWWELI